MEYRLVAQEFGKDDSFGGTYRILKQHAEILRFEKQIRDAFPFQWMPGPGIYRPVWYFLRLDASQGLLAVFFDMGGDPRPHVLGRIVALCNKREHIPLLLAVQNSAVKSFSCDDSGMLTIDCVPGQGEFVWSTRILQAGDRGSYAGLGESPEPRKSDPKPAPRLAPKPLPGSTPPSRTPAPGSLWVLCILLVLCLSSIIAAIFFYNRSQQRSSELKAAQDQIASLKQHTLSSERDKRFIEISNPKAEKGKNGECCNQLEEERNKFQDALGTAYKSLGEIVESSEKARESDLPAFFKADRLSEKVEKKLKGIIEAMEPFVQRKWTD